MNRTMEKLIHFCNRRGFVYSGSKIYGGLRGTFDYGPLGMQLKKNISDLWWKDFVEQRIDCVGLDSSIILHPNVWKTSGHIDEFTDPLIECSICQHRSGEVVSEEDAAWRILEQQVPVMKEDDEINVIAAKAELDKARSQLKYLMNVQAEETPGIVSAGIHSSGKRYMISQALVCTYYYFSQLWPSVNI